MRADDPKPMLADPAVILHVLIADLRGAGGGGEARVLRQVAHRLLHLIERPAEIDGGWPGGGERLAGAVERLVGLVVAQAKADAVGSGCPNSGAPRTCMVEIARAASSSVRSVTVSKRKGSLVWSMISTDQPSGLSQMVR